MITWTCYECGNDYVDKVTGDVDERMCYECLDRDSYMIEGDDYRNEYNDNKKILTGELNEFKIIEKRNSI